MAWYLNNNPKLEGLQPAGHLTLKDYWWCGALGKARSCKVGLSKTLRTKTVQDLRAGQKPAPSMLCTLWQANCKVKHTFILRFCFQWQIWGRYLFKTDGYHIVPRPQITRT